MAVSALESDFIGRKDELDQLKAVFRAAAGGKGSTVLIAGEAGIGNTRLLAHWQRWLLEQNARVGAGDCLDYAQAPYAPFVDALRALLATDPAALEHALAARSILSERIPELGGSRDARRGQVSKRQLFDAFAEAMRIMAERAPVVIGIEDLHWADQDSLDLILHLSKSTARERFVVAVTYRDETPEDGPLAAVLARLLRRANTVSVRLAPLEAIHVRTLMQRALRTHPSLDRPALARRLELAEGNPFYAEELLRHAIEGGGPDVPLTLRAVILERLRALRGDQRLVLAHAAVIGRDFEPSLLAAALSYDVDDVVKALRVARDARLIVEVPAQPVSYRFRHALVQQVLRRELLVPEMQAIHAKVARALEARAAASGSRAMELAHHYWEAHDLEKTRQYAELAGDAASNALAHAQAAMHYERAAEAGAALPRDERSRLYEKLAFSLLEAGMVERSLRAFALALDCLKDARDAERTGNLHLGMSRAERLFGDRTAALRHADAALALTASLTRSLVRYRAFVFKATLAANVGDLPVLLANLEEAQAFSGEPDLGRLSRVHALRAQASSIQGRFDDAKREIDTAIELSRESADGVTLSVNYNDAAIIHDEAGDLATALAMCERAIQAAQERLLTHAQAVACVNRGLYHLLLGDLSAARRSVESSIAA
ncbi:MAG: AAA family ATPase, partial [Candidatus Eremiobacteraeota bacterium]|nr:AAA family ATPase [Candidatus Eremiobacteraeota bacterium]